MCQCISCQNGMVVCLGSNNQSAKDEGFDLKTNTQYIEGSLCGTLHEKEFRISIPSICSNVVQQIQNSLK